MPHLAQSTTAPPLDVHALREREFPFVGRTPYLNAASVAPLPERARRAIDAYNRRRSSIQEITADDFDPTLARARSAAARLIGAGEDEIALLPNTSYGVNLAAQCLPIERGRRIVVSDLEFPANVYPWLRLEREGLATVTIVPTDALGRPDEDRLFAELDRGDVAVFALSAVQFVNGWNADLPRFGRFCRERGTFFVVDAIQSVGQVPTDVRAAEVDILAVGGQKWLCAPFGTGFAYVRRELIPTLEPKTVGWTAAESNADLSWVCDYDYDLRETGRRFEVSTQPWQEYAGFTQSLELLLEVGVEPIRAHVLALIDPLAAWLAEQEGMEILSEMAPERRSGIFAFRPRDAEKAFRALHRAGIGCVLREGAVRVSPHLYNTHEDIGMVMEVLERREGW